MKMLRRMLMSKEEIVKEMIQYIEFAEENLQATQLVNGGKVSKSGIVNNILAELERKVSDED